jgi:recombination protein RecA
MPSASSIRLKIEAALADRIPSALTPAAHIIRPQATTGLAEVDELLNGGLPLGAISELTGPECSGRTSVALSFAAQATAAGSVCAWVDVCDALSPESAAAAGVDLKRLLWIRCGVSSATRHPHNDASFRLPERYRAPPTVQKGLHGGGFGPHPRTEVKGLSQAVGNFLQPEALAPRCAEPLPRQEYRRETIDAVSPRSPSLPLRRMLSAKPWQRIEQALRVADLLLQAGGFAVIVFDMAGVAPEHASRIPLATWFRYRAAVERSQTSLLLLTQYPCAKSSGEVLLRFQHGKACCDESTVFAGVEYRAELERRRFTQAASNVVSIRKPPQRETGASWSSRAVWAGAR